MLEGNQEAFSTRNQRPGAAAHPAPSPPLSQLRPICHKHHSGGRLPRNGVGSQSPPTEGSHSQPQLVCGDAGPPALGEEGRKAAPVNINVVAVLLGGEAVLCFLPSQKGVGSP